MATTLSTPLQTLSLQSQVQPLSLQTLPDDIQQRVLAGVPLDDHQATASACKAFRAVIRGPNFLALRRRYGFSERGVVVVENTTAPAMSLKVITSGITTSIVKGIRGGSPVTTGRGTARIQKRPRRSRRGPPLGRRPSSSWPRPSNRRRPDGSGAGSGSGTRRRRRTRRRPLWKPSGSRGRSARPWPRRSSRWSRPTPRGSSRWRRRARGRARARRRRSGGRS